MNLPHDRQIAEWLTAGSAKGPPESLARALAATRRTRKRPRWTFPERWLPVHLTLTRTPSLRPVLSLVMLALLIGALVATALFIGSQRRLPPSPFHNGPIVYASNGDLFVVDEVHGTPQALGVGPDATLPAFSPLGDRIAFMREGGPLRTSVAVVDRDGSDVTQLASLSGWYPTHLDWAPDASAVVASTNGIAEGGAFGTGPSTWRLAVLAADGSRVRMVHAGPGMTAGHADWRPDGRQIAFVGYSEGARTAFIADRDGTNARAIPGATDVASNGVAWSQDGTRLAFLSYRDDRTAEITVADVDPKGTVTRLISIPPDPAIDDLPHTGPPVEVAGITPAWSPDGGRLAYGLVRGTSVRVGIVAPDGSDSQTVEPVGGGAATDLDWSPDARWLVVINDAVSGSGLLDAGNDVGRAWLVDPATGETTPADELVGDWLPQAP